MSVSVRTQELPIAAARVLARECFRWTNTSGMGTGMAFWVTLMATASPARRTLHHDGEVVLAAEVSTTSSSGELLVPRSPKAFTEAEDSYPGMSNRTFLACPRCTASISPLPEECPRRPLRLGIREVVLVAALSGEHYAEQR